MSLPAQQNSLPQSVDDVTSVMMGDNNALIAAARGAVIDSEPTLSTAVDLLKSIKERVNAVERERKTWVEPLNNQVKRINAEFKKLSEPLADAEIGLKRKVVTFQSQIEAKKREEAEIERQRRADELLAAAAEKESLGNVEGAEKLLGYAEKVKAHVEETGRGGFTGAKSVIQKRWTYEVVDIKALAQTNPAFVIVNAGAVRDAIRDGVREVPGLRIYQEESVSVR